MLEYNDKIVMERYRRKLNSQSNKAIIRLGYHISFEEIRKIIVLSQPKEFIRIVLIDIYTPRALRSRHIIEFHPINC